MPLADLFNIANLFALRNPFRKIRVIILMLRFSELPCDHTHRSDAA